MERLTTNCPDNNLDAALNLFYIKDFETWVRGGGDGPDYPDIRLYDFIRKAAKILLPDLDFPMDDDGIDYAMGELLLDGPDEPTGLLALLYTAAWSYAELRGRLMQYEDTWLMPEEIDMDHEAAEQLRHLCRDCDLDRLRELAESDSEGRAVVLPCKVGDTVYILRRTFDGADVVGETELWWDDIPKLGKTVFLTREEAEQTLRKEKVTE